MSHEHYKSAYRYEGKQDIPWHRLGTPWTPDMDVVQFGEMSGLMEPLLRLPVFFGMPPQAYPDSHFEAAGIEYPSTWDDHPLANELRHVGKVGLYDGRDVIWRIDDGNKAVPLSIVSSSYKLVQPAEIFEFILELCHEQGYEMETAGLLRFGKIFWALAKIPLGTTIRGDDVQGYILIASSCDGSLPTIICIMGVRVVCMNTLRAAILAGGKHQRRVRHSTNFDADQIKREMGLVDVPFKWNEYMEKLKRFAETPLERPLEYLADVIGEDDPFGKPKRPFRNLRKSFYNGRGQDTTAMRLTAGNATVPTLWAGINAVTRYADHDRQANSDAMRFENAWFGSGEQLKERAIMLADRMVAEEDA